MKIYMRLQVKKNDKKINNKQDRKKKKMMAMRDYPGKSPGP
jgi:hypothetical protein